MAISREPAPLALPLAAALVPPLLVALGGGVARTALQLRGMTLGLALGADHAGTAPLAQLLAPIGTLLPFGDLDLRAQLALSIPAAIAAALITRRAGRHPSGTTGLAPRAIVLAIGIVAGALLASCDASASMTVIAGELSIAALFVTPARKRDAFALAFAVSAFAAWCSPRSAVPIALVAALSARAARPLPFAPILTRAASLFSPVLIAGLILDGIRSVRGWLVIGRALSDGVMARAPEDVVPHASAFRIAIAGVLLATIAIASSASAGKLAIDDRIAAIASALLAVGAWLLHPSGGAIPAIVVILPTAAASLGALHIAIERTLGHELSPGWRALSWIVPALALGGASRAFEDDLRARHVTSDASAAPAMAALATDGVSPPRAVLVVEEEESLVRFAHDRALFALRPDMRVLPTYKLLFGGASTMAQRTIAAIPAAGELVRGLLATATLEESDAAPLAQEVPVLAALGTPRIKALARHVDPTGGAVMLALERVDPSDRRVRRAPLERRLAFVIGALSSRPTNDGARTALRIAATREARLLSLALDREGAMAALARALALGADEARIARWISLVKSKKSLDAEPPTEDD